MDPLFEYTLFSSLAMELNQSCLYPNSVLESSHGKSWSGKHFYFLSDIIKGKVFDYTENGCEDRWGIICHNCHQLIESTQEELLGRLHNKISKEESEKNREIVLIAEKVNLLQQDFNEKMENIYIKLNRLIRELEVFEEQFKLLTSEVINLKKDQTLNKKN